MHLRIEQWLPVEIALVARSGEIVHGNRKWQETARSGNLPDRRWNYLEECEAATRRGCMDADKIAHALRGVLRGDALLALVTYSCPFGGLHHWYEAVISPMPVAGRRHALIMHVDVSELQRDALTGLANRAFFDAQLAHVIALAEKSGQLTGIISVDVDNLKPLNDGHGHQVGDQALKVVTNELSARASAVCSGCVVCRVGGDEFAVVLPPVPDELALHRILARFEPRMVAAFSVPGTTLVSVTASVGAAVYPADGKSVAALYKSADRAVYAVKRGRPSAA